MESDINFSGNNYKSDTRILHYTFWSFKEKKVLSRIYQIFKNYIRNHWLGNFKSLHHTPDIFGINIITKNKSSFKHKLYTLS